MAPMVWPLPAPVGMTAQTRRWDLEGRAEIGQQLQLVVTQND